MQLLYFGIQVPEEFDNDHWSHEFRDWLDDLVAFEYHTARETLRSRMRSFSGSSIRNSGMCPQSSALFRKHYKKDYMLLRSIPGIGGIVACGIIKRAWAICVGLTA